MLDQVALEQIENVAPVKRTRRKIRKVGRPVKGRNGERFGSLTVVGVSKDKTPSNNVKHVCRCDCGAVVVRWLKIVRGRSLVLLSCTRECDALLNKRRIVSELKAKQSHAARAEYVAYLHSVMRNRIKPKVHKILPYPTSILNAPRGRI